MAEGSASPSTEEELGLEVGDTVIILGGRLNKTIGKLYGFSSDRMAILPKGATDRIIKIPFIDGLPDPAYEIQTVLLYKKAVRPGFVTLVDIRAGQDVETFGADSEPTGVFKVIKVDEEKDSAVFQDESGTEEEIVFGYTGIPRDLPYEVIRGREESEVKTQDPSSEGENPSSEGKEPSSEGEEPSSESQETTVSRIPVEEEDILENGQAPSQAEEAPLDFAVGQVIELAPEEELQEIDTANRFYDDAFQRSEMLSQLIRSLPKNQQRDPIKLQEVRRFVEQMLILRNEVVKYGVTGDPAGLKATSIHTLSELITRPDVPLSRKVVDMSKVLYLDYRNNFKTAEGNTIFKEEDPDAGPLEEGLYAEYLIDIIKRAQVIQGSANETNATQEAAIQMPKFFLDMEIYRKQIQSPLMLEPGTTAVEHDEEVFRREVPDFESPELNTLEVIGKHMKKDITVPVFNPPEIKQSPFAITRLLKRRWGRFLSGDLLRVVEPAETPSYTNVLVFPMSSLRDLGPIRSGILAQDMSLGAMEPSGMEKILQELGEITDFPTEKNILNIGVKGNIIGNVFIKDWIAALKLRIGGLGDAYASLSGYGTKDIEWNVEQAKVLQDKIEQRLAALKLFMGKQRQESAAALANLRFEPQPTLALEDGARLLTRIESEPLLQKVLSNVKEYMGDLASVDINWFSYVFNEYPDLLLAALGQQAAPLARERLRHVRMLYTKARIDGYRLKRKIMDSGEVPQENTCPHVKKLAEIRKVAKATEDEPRDVRRVKLLIQLLNEFRGHTEDDWISCKVCEKHLICAHELIQIQEYLRPTEQETLHKEMLIKFSGGQFSGKYICRVCGQSIGNLEFDQSLEFDDEGRPMMGRSVMVDREAIELDELEELLKGPAEVVKEVSFGTDALDTMYLTIKKMCGLLGINPDEEEYRVMVDELSTYMLSLPSRELYAQATKGKKAQDFDIFYSVRYVSAAAAILLLKIQTRVPDYMVYYTSADCKEGFFGYPLEEGQTYHGIRCVASIVAGINDAIFPWNLTTLQKQGNLLKRREAIEPLIKGQIDAFIKHPVQQAMLKKKREYRTKIFGGVSSGARTTEQIAQSFRPIPYVVSEEEAAAAPVSAAAATPEKQATAWIRMAHKVARQNAALNPDAPLSETTCCLHKISSDTTIFATPEFPQLEPRIVSVTHRGSLTTTFYTQMPKALEGRVDPKDYYKLFVHSCYQGDNKGLPHKLGLTLTCSECGLNFKQNPHLPFSVEADSKKAREEEAKAAADLQAHLVSQGLVINEETAQDLLTTSRLKSKVTKDFAKAVPRLDQMFTELAQLIEPMEGWSIMLNSIQVTLRELGQDVSRLQIAKAAEDLVQRISEKEGFIRQRLGEEVFKYVDSLTKKSPRECGEAISAFILVPFQRWISGIDVKGFMILDSYELSKDTKDDIMVRGLGAYLNKIGDDAELGGLLLRKVRAFVADLSELCRKVFPSLRAVFTPGGSIMVQYLLRAYVMGTVQKFVDPHHIPDFADGETQAEEEGVVNMKLLYKALAQSLTKYAVGNRIPTEEEIRLALEKRAEKEKQQFIGEIDRMSRDERKVELTMKGLGMGKWAAGGKKSIRQYDPERYEVERAERAAAGIVDYVPVVDADRPVDMFGADFGADYDAGGERMDGDYTDGAMREDDY
jgi:hypothetical protein